MEFARGVSLIGNMKNLTGLQFQVAFIEPEFQII
jgi:hypothetical protein